ncbi:MAG: hypothetical protein Q8L88_02135 [Bacteroidota bacterium]|nr:hypothetical protein [Bacteroidota bacterium]
MVIKKSTETRSTYENVEARCPYCSYWNIYNRASDIKNFKLLIEKIVVCQSSSCNFKFLIEKDLINPAWQMLILDCEVLKQRKQYSYCILNLTQSFEMYFALFLRVELLYKPFGIEKSYNENLLNKISDLLFESTRKWPFYLLRNTFINFITNKIKSNGLEQSNSIILDLKLYSSEPTNEAIKSIEDNKLSDLILRLKNTQVNILRNRIIHKYGYRPTVEEVESSKDETEQILFGIDYCLGVLNERRYLYE